MYPALFVTISSVLLIVAILWVVGCPSFRRERLVNQTCVSHFITQNTICIDLKTKVEKEWFLDFQSRWRGHEENINRVIIDLVSRIPPNSIILEAGGHVGDTTIMMGLQLKLLDNRSEVWSVEPDKTKVAFINKIVTENDLAPFVKTFQFALSDKKSKGNIIRKKGSYLNGAGAWKVQESSTHAGEIKFTTIDDLYTSKKKLYLLKLDVEGFEIKALQGGKNTIERFKPVVIVEAWKRNEQKISRCLSSLSYRKTSGKLNGDIVYYPVDS